jgi:vesicle coat complex subunit
LYVPSPQPLAVRPSAGPDSWSLARPARFPHDQGYLAITLLLHENSDLIRLVINSIRKDLDDSSEINNCLALHAIANIGGKEMAESLAPDVHRLLISPVTGSFVKKKAALTLLRLYRKHPSVIPLAEWGERVTTIMDDENLVCMFFYLELVFCQRD